MKFTDTAGLLALGALWGSSYLFMRIGAPEFGAVPLAALRVAVAAVLLLPLLAARRGLPQLRAFWKPIALVGLTSSALPFASFSFAALSITAGLSAILTASTPLFAAVIAWLWRGEKLPAPRIAGLAIGFAGVLWLAWGTAHVTSAGSATAWAVAACLAGSCCYGFSANFTQRFLSTVPPLAVATGSHLTSALALALPAVVSAPPTTPAPRAWAALAVLAVAGTAAAYVLFFRLIARIGPARATTVSYLVPAFGVLWGVVFLGETFTGRMTLGCAVILIGSALTTGLIAWPARRGFPAWFTVPAKI